MPLTEDSQGTKIRSEGPSARVTVSITLKPKFGRDELKAKYGVAKYDLATGYAMAESLKTLVPKGTPEYVDRGQNYVERLMRALFHFKQCALIGPSGTGKSVCAGEPVFVAVSGRPMLTTVDDLFEKMARKLPVAVDGDGWETVLLTGTDIRVLSMDVSSGDVSWRRPLALSRSRYNGPIVEVTTERNRMIRATPEHSLLTDGDEIKAQKIKVGVRIPIIRRLPKTGAAPLATIAVADYVPAAKVTERGVVMSGRETIQVPAPPILALTEDIAWFLGFFVAEGYIGKGFASVCNENAELTGRCARLMSSLGLATSTRKQRGLAELRVFSEAFVAMLSTVTLTRRVGRGKGSQARYKKVPDFVYSIPDQSKAAFLRGFFEGDGWFEKGSEVILGTSNKDLANRLVLLFEQLGIFPTIRMKGGGRGSYSVVIARDGATKLGLTVPGDAGGTDHRGHVEKIKVTPELLAAAKRAYLRLPSELKSKRLHKNTVSYFYPVGRMLGLGTLSRIARNLRSPELTRASETDILWDPVRRVNRAEYNGWVYDFQVPGTETFAAGFGGVMTHNTHIVYLVAELAGLPLWEINCGLQTSVYDMFGRFVGLGKENWVDGQIVSWCRYGGILYLDEANMMKQDVATRLNPLLDTRGHMVLTERDNEVIPRHTHGYVVISMNPYSAEFAGTKPLNAAFRRRMSVWIDFDYLSVGATVAPDEVQMVSKRSKASLDVAEKIVRVGAEIRRRYKAGDLPYGPSVGDLVNWATLVADGLDPTAAAEETIVSLTSDDPEVQTTVRRVVRMVLGDTKVTSG